MPTTTQDLSRVTAATRTRSTRQSVDPEGLDDVRAGLGQAERRDGGRLDHWEQQALQQVAGGDRNRDEERIIRCVALLPRTVEQVLCTGALACSSRRR